MKALTISVLLSIVVYMAFTIWGGWHEVAAAFTHLSTTNLLILLGLSLVNYSLRYLRWHMYLSRMGHRVPHTANFRIYLSGFALTTTPGKAGETFRGVFLKDLGVPFKSSIAAFISERLSDLLAIVLLTFAGLSQAPFGHWIVLTGGCCILVAFIVLSNQSLLQKLALTTETSNSRSAKLIAPLIHILVQARTCHTPAVLGLATLISVIAWGSEALAFIWLLEWLNGTATPSFAIFVYAFSMLAGALSFMPGGLGGSEAAMISLLVLGENSVPIAVAATIIIRISTLWFAVVLGLVCLFLSQKRIGSQ